MSKGLFSSALWGVQWTTLSMGVTTILQLVYTSIMARLLTPEIFGLMAIAQVILHFASFFSKLGMGRALIQKEQISSIDIRAVFTSSFLLSAFFCSMIWILAPFIGDFFKKSDDLLILVIRVMSLTFLLTGLTATAQSLIIRDCKFKLLSKIEMSSFVVFLIVGVTLGLLDFGIWSLVFAFISQSFVNFLAMYFFTRHSFLPVFKWEYHKPFYSYGTVFSLTSLVDFIGNNVVQILIGKFYGDYKLGIYRQANNILHLPLVKLSQSINNVFFPLMTKIQNDLPKLKKSYLSANETMSNLLFPICLGISAASSEIVLLYLGEKFVESGPILAVLSLGLGFQFLIPYSGVVLDATANLTKKFFVQLFYVLGLISVIYLLRNYDIVILATAVVIGVFIRNIIYAAMVCHLLSISLKEYSKSVLPGILKGIISYFSIFAITWLMNEFSFDLLLKILIQLIVGGILVIYHLVINPLPSFGRIWRDIISKNPKIENKFGSLLGYCNWYSHKEKFMKSK